MFAHRPGRDVVELAKPVGTQGLVGRMAGDDAHHTISRSGSINWMAFS